MTVRAAIRTRNAPLWEEFGLEYATRLFGQETIDSLPRYVRGPKAGKINAWISWDKVEKGGWSRQHGGVVYPNQLARARICADAYGKTALTGKFLGDDTVLDFDGSLLGEKGRAAEAERRRSWREDAERQMADEAALREQLAAMFAGRS